MICIRASCRLSVTISMLMNVCVRVCVFPACVDRSTTPVSRGPPDLSYLQGLAFTCMYLLYIQVTRNSLSVFDCTTTNNPMGVRTLDGNPGIQCSLHDPVWKQVRWWWMSVGAAKRCPDSACPLPHLPSIFVFAHSR